MTYYESQRSRPRKLLIGWLQTTGSAIILIVTIVGYTFLNDCIQNIQDNEKLKDLNESELSLSIVYSLCLLVLVVTWITMTIYVVSGVAMILNVIFSLIRSFIRSGFFQELLYMTQIFLVTIFVSILLWLHIENTNRKALAKYEGVVEKNNEEL